MFIPVSVIIRYYPHFRTSGNALGASSRLAGAVWRFCLRARVTAVGVLGLAPGATRPPLRRIRRITRFFFRGCFRDHHTPRGWLKCCEGVQGSAGEKRWRHARLTPCGGSVCEILSGIGQLENCRSVMLSGGCLPTSPSKKQHVQGHFWQKKVFKIPQGS